MKRSTKGHRMSENKIVNEAREFLKKGQEVQCQSINLYQPPLPKHTTGESTRPYSDSSTIQLAGLEKQISLRGKPRLRP